MKLALPSGQNVPDGHNIEIPFLGQYEPAPHLVHWLASEEPSVLIGNPGGHGISAELRAGQ